METPLPRPVICWPSLPWHGVISENQSVISPVCLNLQKTQGRGGEALFPFPWMHPGPGILEPRSLHGCARLGPSPRRAGGRCRWGRASRPGGCPDENWVHRGCSGRRDPTKLCQASLQWGHPSGRTSSERGPWDLVALQRVAITPRWCPSSIRGGPGRAPGPCATGGQTSVGLREERAWTEVSGVPVLLCAQFLSHPVSQGPAGMALLEPRVRKSAAPGDAP